MKAPPLLFLGDRRRDAVLARAAANARRWREAWAPGSAEQFEAQCEPPASGGFAGPVATVATSCWGIDSGGERVAVLLLPHSTFVWCVQQPGATSAETGGDPGADSLAEQLEREVAETLFAEFRAGQHEPVRATRIATDTLAEWTRRTRAWTLQVKATGTARGFTLLLGASHIEALAPARGVLKRDALKPRREAIGENLLAVRAVVGEASMSVSDLAELALDDVLVLDQHLAEPITLVSRTSGVAIAAGNLGRTGPRRAFKVAGPVAREQAGLKN